MQNLGEKPRVVVAMSGGVDSSVAALLLKQSGYHVYGVHMINWDRQANELKLESECESQSIDRKYAQEVADLLDIPLKIYNFTAEYWREVFFPYIKDLKNNLLGNPDVYCNEKIKFGILLETVQKDFGSDIKLATGHYAKVNFDGKNHYLEAPLDKKKDQTFFLSRLNQEQLKNIIFPLGQIESKLKVRQLAKENNFPNWNKKGSSGICFIGKRNFKNFISQFLDNNSGDIKDIETQNILGSHDGVYFYSLNQRKGVNISGNTEKYYICRRNYQDSELYVCRESQKEKYLMSSGCKVQSLNWIKEIPKKEDEIYLKLRYTGDFILGRIENIDSENLVFSHSPQAPSTPGQIVAFYSKDKNRCLGSGKLKEVIFKS